MSHLRMKKIVLVLSVVILLIVSTSSFAIGTEDRKDLIETGSQDPAAMVVDIAAARPVGFAALVTGSVFFVISLPFSLLGGNADVAFEKMVEDPARYTFKRPLGSF